MQVLLLQIMKFHSIILNVEKVLQLKIMNKKLLHNSLARNRTDLKMLGTNGNRISRIGSLGHGHVGLEKVMMLGMPTGTTTVPKAAHIYHTLAFQQTVAKGNDTPTTNTMP